MRAYEFKSRPLREFDAGSKIQYQKPDGLTENQARRRPLITYLVRLRLHQGGYHTMMDTTVQARTAEMARRMVRAQYGSQSILVGQPRRISAK
jgi:hypothetical protein